MNYGFRMDTNPTTIDRILKAMEAAERSQKWTADKAGFSVTTLHRKLHGGADFTVGEVARIARALGIRPLTLLPDEFALEAVAAA